MGDDKTAFLDATAQTELVRGGEVSASELVEATLRRIDRLNPELNAVIVPMDELARAAGETPVNPDAPFPGVPFLLKDLVA
jgi:amidase